MNPGGTNERFVREHLHSARVVVHEDNRTIFAALASGEGDVMITDAVEARLEAQANPALCVSQPPVLFETVEKAYLIPKGSGVAGLAQPLAREDATQRRHRNDHAPLSRRAASSP